MPLLSRIEKPRPVPNSIADDVLAGIRRQGRGVDRARARRCRLFARAACRTRAREIIRNRPVKWSFAGPMGKFDRGSLQRGLKVLQGSLNCHGLSYVAFRNRPRTAAPGYSAAQAAAFVEIQDQGRPS